MHQEPKKAYARPQGPQLRVIGSVSELTHTGNTNPNATDIKGGSVASQGQ